MTMMRVILALTVLLLRAGAAEAHKPSDSYLALAVEGARVQGRWDIALRDLDYAIGLDADGDGRITWGELRTRHDAIAAYALARLELAADGRRCTVAPAAQAVDRHSDGAYTVLRFSAECAGAPAALTVSYRLLFDLDPQHRGLLRVEQNGAHRSAILSPDRPSARMTADDRGALRQLGDYAREGVWHIWIGYDHVLFLVALLLPAVLERAPTGWRARPAFRPSAIEILKVVTAFTLAHSITLSAAALDLVQLPARWVESAIAASVVLSAANNLRPLVLGRRSWIAFGFGLVHGFGFASVLADLGLPRDGRMLSLIGFNLGVELGQAAIVALFLPAAYLLRRSRWYTGALVPAGSSAIAVVAAIWLTERLLGVRLLP